MMAWTYTTLVQAIKDFTEYSETTFNDNIDTFIQNCEERLLYAVSLEVFRKNIAGTCTASNKYLGVPTDFLSPFSLSVTASGSTTFLLNKDVEYLQEYNPTGATGVPKYYAFFDINTFLLAPVPASGYATELHYYYRPASIVTAGTSWLGTNAEQALLYGTLVEAYTYMKGEPDLIQLYNNRFLESLNRLKNFGEGRETVDAYRDGLIRVKAN
jgi:hypothetical protein